MLDLVSLVCSKTEQNSVKSREPGCARGEGGPVGKLICSFVL